ncbi:MAG TPA: hypothetical protein VFX58_16775 [Chitinophagaceae bacterium]|nr:hypothetical protein [Chitinophagaceae bacterium]
MARIYGFVKRITRWGWSRLTIRSCEGSLLPPTNIPVTATIWDMKEEGRAGNGLVQIRYWVMIKWDGRIACRHITGLVRRGHLPVVGDKIQICFCPNDLSRVTILSTSKPNQHI